MKKDNKYINKQYLKFISKTEPRTKEIRTLVDAFMIGGLICSVGQFIRYVFTFVFGLGGDELAGATSIVMIFLGTLFTGLGIYDRIGKYAGGGTIVPITGFANSVCSPAIEFKSEGYVFGMASKMFVIAGPVIVYGVAASVIYGLIIWLLGVY